MLLTEGEGYLGTSGYDGPGAARLVGDKAFGGSDQIGRDFGSGARGGSIFDIINCFHYRGLHGLSGDYGFYFFLSQPFLKQPPFHRAGCTQQSDGFYCGIIPGYGFSHGIKNRQDGQIGLLLNFIYEKVSRDTGNNDKIGAGFLKCVTALNDNRHR
jgi:hypothetical protein